MMAMSYFLSFETPVTIVRPFNTYGPRQSARAVIPAILQQLHSGAKEIKLGLLTPTRLHLLDRHGVRIHGRRRARQRRRADPQPRHRA